MIDALFPLLTDTSFGFGTRTVLHRVTLTLKRGAINCLLGPSGCGKSTLLRVAGGLLRQTGGAVHVDPRECALVFQDSRLLRWLTVEENLSLSLIESPRHERRRRIEEVLDLMQLRGAGKHLPRELSGGMAQRVGIARALLLSPSLLLMDEPFAALDAITRADLQQILKNLVTAQRKTCLFVTHDISEALSLGDRLFVMREGMIIQQLEAPWTISEARERILCELERDSQHATAPSSPDQPAFAQPSLSHAKVLP